MSLLHHKDFSMECKRLVLLSVKVKRNLLLTAAKGVSAFHGNPDETVDLSEKGSRFASTFSGLEGVFKYRYDCDMAHGKVIIHKAPPTSKTGKKNEAMMTGASKPCISKLR